MITEKDLQEAIAECEGQRNPNSNTCVKLAAFYIIKDHLFGKDEVPESRNNVVIQRYSADAGPIAYTSDTDFGQIISKKDTEEVLALMDELMSTLMVVEPRLYASVLRKLSG